jgi:LuxR family transcriptional regulator, maltose regulon positive regulatory protein
VLMPLLQTKLNVPGFHHPDGRSNYVSRQRLIKKLNSGFAKKLTLLCAPAGFGKSTLLVEWIKQGTDQGTIPHRGLPPSFGVAWLSLDPRDNDPIRFWSYVVAALQSIDAEIGVPTLALLQSPQSINQSMHPEVLLTPLLNDLAIHPDPFVLVLDDYHVINALAVHQALLFLLDHLPPLLHIVLSSRTEPPWPLARWRSQGQLVELHIDDLRFTPDEAACFLKEIMTLDLSATAISALETRTEGWIAGLQLAALSLQGVTDRDQFIARFSGSNRYIVDYLVEEVLSQQSEEMQSFLLKTSILEQLCGALCDTVVRQTGDGEGGQIEARSLSTNHSQTIHSQTILEQLEHANLFLIPLDDERKWYRYHQLFAEVLRLRLRQNYPSLIPELHHRASLWYEGIGQIETAVGYALAVPDIERAATLVEGVAMAILLHRSEVLMMRKLMERLPIAIIHARPQLTLAYGIALALFGQFDAVEQLLFNASAALNSPDLPDEVTGGLMVLHSTIARFRGDMANAITFAQQALEKLPTYNHPLRAAAVMTIGVAHLQRGESLAGQQTLTEAITIAVASGAEYIALACLEELATYQARRGHLTQAKQICEEALAHAMRWGAHRMPAAGLAHIGIGEVLCERNELEGAMQSLRDGIHLLQGTTERSILARSHTALARAQRAKGDIESARLTLQRGGEWLVQMEISATAARAWLDAQQVRLAISQGDLTSGLSWSQTVQVGEESAVGYVQQLTLVRVRLAQYQHDPQPRWLTEATQLLTALLVAAETNGWMSHVIEIWLLAALVAHAQRARVAAQDALTHALALAEPEGYVRIFVDEGEPVRLMLLDLKLWLAPQRPDEAQRLLSYVNTLLGAMDTPQITQEKTTQEKASSHEHLLIQNLVEPLTERELEILRLVNSGLSNNEIAALLIVTVGTVKKHLNNIFGKLGVGSRTQALVSARTLDLL